VKLVFILPEYHHFVCTVDVRTIRQFDGEVQNIAMRRFHDLHLAPRPFTPASPLFNGVNAGWVVLQARNTSSLPARGIASRYHVAFRDACQFSGHQVPYTVWVFDRKMAVN